MQCGMLCCVVLIFRRLFLARVPCEWFPACQHARVADRQPSSNVAHSTKTSPPQAKHTGCVKPAASMHSETLKQTTQQLLDSKPGPHDHGCTSQIAPPAPIRCVTVQYMLQTRSGYACGTAGAQHVHAAPCEGHNYRKRCSTTKPTATALVTQTEANQQHNTSSRVPNARPDLTCLVQSTCASHQHDNPKTRQHNQTSSHPAVSLLTPVPAVRDYAPSVIINCCKNPGSA